MDADEFERRESALQSDRDARLKDNASLRKGGLITTEVKKERDNAALAQYDSKLEQLVALRDSLPAVTHTPTSLSSSAASSSSSCSSSRSSSNEMYVNIRVKEGRNEIVARRSVGVAATTLFTHAVERAVGDDDEWNRLKNLPLAVTAFRSAEEKAKESILVGTSSPVVAATDSGYNFLLAVFTAARVMTAQTSSSLGCAGVFHSQ